MLVSSIVISSAVNNCLLLHLASFRAMLTVEEKYILINSGCYSLDDFCYYKKNNMNNGLGSTLVI